MKDFNIDTIKENGLELYNIIISHTEGDGYEEERSILVEGLEDMKEGEYVVIEGSHCSCYGFDDTEWDATLYSENELMKLALADYNRDSIFWKRILKYLRSKRKYKY